VDWSVRERVIRVLCEIGSERVVGRGGGDGRASKQEEEVVVLVFVLVVEVVEAVFDWVRRGESEGRREMPERIWGVVVRRTI
jgi:hypothetical protein